MLGYNVDLGDDLLLKPAIYASAYDFNYFRLQYNVSMWYQDKFWLGVGGNDIGQIGGNIGFSPQEDIKVSYSYNTPTGGQRIALGNSHEFHTFIGFSALGGGSRSAGSGDGDGDGEGNADVNSANGESGDEGEGNANVSSNGKSGGKNGSNGDGSGGFGMSKEATIASLEDMRTMGMGNDTSKIKLPNIEKVKPGPGFYLVAGLHSSEAKANKQIKDLYKKGVLSYKIYDPSNKSYYVYLKDFPSEKDANRGIFYYEASVPQVWIREVK
jgi:hypothetical protein